MDLSTPRSLQLFCGATSIHGTSPIIKTYNIITGSSIILTDPEDQVTAGLSVTFTCLSTANGGAVTFKKSESPSLDLSSLTTSEATTDNKIKNSLVIPEPTTADRGTFYCEDANGARTSGAFMYFLEVSVAAETSFINLGEEVTFVCRVTGLVGITWNIPTGITVPSDTTVINPSSLETVAELTVTANEDGLYYCIAADIVSSKGIQLIVMDVELQLPQAVQGNDDIAVTCKVNGDHDGVTISNGGKVLPVETPSDAMSSMASGSKTTYTTTYNAALAEFTDGVTSFKCTAYYDNFGQVYSEDMDVYYIGFYQQPIEIQVVSPSAPVEVAAYVSAAHDAMFIVYLMDADTNEIVSQTTQAKLGDPKAITLSIPVSTMEDRNLYFKLDADGVIVLSDSFTLEVFGSKVASPQAITFPGPDIDSMTLSCIIKSPYEVPVTWYENNENLGFDNPSIVTSYDSSTKILTSLFTLDVTQALSSVKCESPILGVLESVTFTTSFDSFNLQPADVNTMFFDEAIKLDPSPPTYTPRVFSPDGTEYNVASTFRLFETREFISVVTWGDDSYGGDYYHTDTVHVAGVYMDEPDDLVAGTVSTVSCKVAQTAHITASTVNWSVTGGTVATSSQNLSGNKVAGNIVVTTDVSWSDSLGLGEKVSITCSVEYTFSDSSASLTKEVSVTVPIDTKCDTTMHIDNGYVTAGAVVILPNQRVTVSCNDGFQLSGMSEYTCKEGKLWDTLPTCVQRSTLCPPIAPEGARVIYTYPDLTLGCAVDQYFPFRASPTLTCDASKGWDKDTYAGLTNVFGFQFCGLKKTPYQKSVTVGVTYASAAPFCTDVSENAAAFVTYKKEVDLDLEGVLIEMEDCSGTADGYTIKVSFR